MANNRGSAKPVDPMNLHNDGGLLKEWASNIDVPLGSGSWQTPSLRHILQSSISAFPD